MNVCFRCVVLEVQPSPKEDEWTTRNVGTPFPPNAVKAFGQTNMYVALGYKHGKPVMGLAWNDSGVVQCSFVMNNTILQGTEIGGQIQLLTYTQTHAEVGFWYDWVAFAKWKEEEGKERSAVRCGNSIPVFMPDRVSLGYYDTVEDKAFMQTGARKFDTCSERPPLMVNDWADFNAGDAFPTDKPVCKALGRALSTPWGVQEQCVALWYRHGKPIMGRAWSNQGTISASFVDSNREFSGTLLGSIQLLIELPSAAAGFDYCWLPYEQASRHGSALDYAPVHIDYVAPCAIFTNGFEILGAVNLKKEVAECTTLNSKVLRFEGGQLKSFMILCRKDRDDTMSI